MHHARMLVFGLLIRSFCLFFFLPSSGIFVVLVSLLVSLLFRLSFVFFHPLLTLGIRRRRRRFLSENGMAGAGHRRICNQTLWSVGIFWTFTQHVRTRLNSQHTTPQTESFTPYNQQHNKHTRPYNHRWKFSFFFSFICLDFCSCFAFWLELVYLLGIIVS